MLDTSSPCAAFRLVYVLPRRWFPPQNLLATEIAVRRLLCFALLPLATFIGVFPSLAREVTKPLDVRFAPPLPKSLSADAPLPAEEPSFQRHVVPLFGRLGCNGRSCHGSFQGQGGFRLSMFGYDFQADHDALLKPASKEQGPRVAVKSPAASLLLTKPVSDDDHGGGRRFDVGGWEYRLLRRWIEAGAKNNAHAGAELERLEVTPAEIVFAREGSPPPVALRVIAHWSDGTREDVTKLTRFSTNDDGTAAIDGDGVVRSVGPGSTYVIACYDSGVVSIPVLRPVSDRFGPRYPQVPTPTKVDQLVVAKLQKLGIVPSELATDAEFLRRVSLDICGTLPRPDEAAAFLDDKSPDKRTRKIDELLARPEYALWWATKLCDMTGLNAPAQLGTTDYGPHVGKQWYDWMHRRLADDDGYDRIVRGIVLAVSIQPGETYDDYVARQTSYMRKDSPADFAAQPWMPYYWFRNNLGTPDEKALGFAYSFLGVRLDCAQCHKHPFDRWSQQDFQDFTQFFARVSKGVHPDRVDDKKALEEKLETVKLDTAAKRRQTFWKWAGEGKSTPWSEVYVAEPEAVKKGKPTATSNKLRLLGGRTVELRTGQDPREPVMEWMLEKDNPYFARAIVNRVWAHYFGVGIVNPADDANLGNPPSNKELMAYLADGFVAHGYDLKWLHREITTSDAYQRSWRPNDTNRHDERLFSKALVRRLPAEVVGDALKLGTASAAKLKNQTEKDLRARYIAQQAPAYERALEYGMMVFGKPINKTNCDCERDPQPSLLQSVYLRNDVDLRTTLARADGWLKTVPKEAAAAELVDEAYLRLFSRRPTAAEQKRCAAYFAEVSDRAEALEDVLWALINTQEFVTNH
jgi:hypothetical protein